MLNFSLSITNIKKFESIMTKGNLKELSIDSIIKQSLI